MTINYLLSPFTVLFFLLIITIKVQTIMFHNGFNNNSIFARRIFYFRQNSLMHGFKYFINVSASISLALEWKVYHHFFSYTPRLMFCDL